MFSPAKSHFSRTSHQTPPPKAADDDSQSIDLLADTPPGEKVAARGIPFESPGSASTSTNLSPGHLTIHQLSQTTSDLHYDMTKLEHDVAKTLASVKHKPVVPLHEESPCSSSLDTTAATTTLPRRVSSVLRMDNSLPGGKENNEGGGDSNPVEGKERKQTPVTAFSKGKRRATAVVQRKSAVGAVSKRNRKEAVVQAKNPACETNRQATTVTQTNPSSHACRGNSKRNVAQTEAAEKNVVAAVKTPTPAPHKNTPQSVEQLDLQTGQVLATFPSLRAAAAELKLSRHAVCKTLEGEREEAGGFGWRIARAAVAVKTRETTSEPKPLPRSLEGMDTKDLHETTQNSRNNTAKSSSTGSPQNSQNTKNPEIRGDGAKTLSLSKKAPAPPRDVRGSSVEQLSLDDGKVVATFRSLREAARVTGIHRKQIRKVLDGKIPHVRGYGRRIREPVDAPSSGPTGLSSKTRGVPSGQRISTNLTKTVKNNENQKRSEFHPVVTESNPGQLSLGDYIILRCTISSEGQLGLDVGRQRPPRSLLQVLDLEATGIELDDSCTVLGVKQSSLSHQSGMRKGDWFVDEAKDKLDAIIPRSFDEVRGEARTAQRPVTFFVARRRTVDGRGTSVTNATDDDVETDIASKQAERTKISTASSSVSQKYEDVTMTQHESVPFCQKCNIPSKNVVSHHVWCPNHERFDDSGGREILEEIKEGMAADCQVCCQEFQSGRLAKDGVHGSGCPRPKMKKSSGKKGAGALLTTKGSATTRDGESRDTQTKRTRKGRAIRPTTKFKEQPDVMAYVGGDDSDGSIFQSDTPVAPEPESPSAILTVPKIGNGGLGPKPQSQKRKVEARNDPGPSQRKKSRSVKERSHPLTTLRGGKKAKGLNDKEKDCGLSQSRYGDDKFDGESRSQSNAPDLPDNMAEFDHGGEPHEMNWDESENPWGPDAFRNDDTVVFAPGLKITEQEASILSGRFSCDPFSRYPRYKQTHRCPEEGLHTIVLRRDLECEAPWGFSVYLHEFGSACLVEDVDPMSPADSATFAGMALTSVSGAGLQVNDMVIAVNGKLTGGMTTVAFDVELATSGSSLILDIARCCHSEQKTKHSEKHEQSVHFALHRKSEDEEHLGWIDVTGEDLSTSVSVTSNQLIDPSEDIDMFHDRRALDAPDGATLGLNLVSIRSPPKDVRDSVGGTISSNAAKGFKRVDARVVPESSKQSPGRDLSTKNLPGLNPMTPLCSNRTNNSSTVTDTTKAPIDNLSVRRSAAEESRDAANERHFPGPRYSVSSEIPSESDEESDVDMNAWLGCLCGENHEKIPVFWIQCDGCKSWYNVSPKCLGMSKNDASKLEEWLCLGCGSVEGSKVALELQFDRTERTRSGSMDGLMENSSLAKPIGGTKTGAAREADLPEKQNPTSRSSKSKPQFGKGDFVLVGEHAWPGVDNPAGIATILSADEDEDGNHFYGIKYIIGGLRKGVYEQYLTHHTF